MQFKLTFLYFLCSLLTLSAQNIGIGTNNPLDKLHVAGSANTMRIEGIATSASYNTATTTSADKLIYANGSGRLASMPNGNSEDILQIDGTGIIGWAAPNFWKTKGNANITVPATPAIYGTNTFASNENWIGTTDANDFVLGSANKERMRINSDGSIAIGLSNSGDASELVTINSVSTKIYPLNAYTATANGIAIWGENTAATGTSTGAGVYGSTIQSNGAGLWGTNAHANGIGIMGQNTVALGTGTGIGILGSSAQSSGAGTKGQNTHIDGDGVVGINSASSNSGTGTGVTGHANQSAGAGVWGQNLNNGGYGIYGVNLAASNTNAGIGVFGGTSQSNGAGVWGQNTNANGDGIIGVNTALSGTSLGNGVYGQTSQRSTVSGVVSGVYGWCNGTGATDFGFPRTSVYGDGSVSGSYAFGIFGDGGTSVRSGGVLGDNYALGRGALGYIAASGTGYSIYGFGGAYQTGGATGRLANPNLNDSDNEMINHVGIGVYGGVMGGWVRGLHYGFHTKGNEYSLYVDGHSISNQSPIQLIENENSDKRTMAYTPASLSADVYHRGSAHLENGEIYIVFDEKFQSAISSEIPLNITITATGESEGLYIAEISANGFKVVENRHGRSNVSFNWLAIGTRKGYESPIALSETILSNNFDKQMNGLMFNDNNTNDEEAVGIYYDGQQVQLGTLPKEFEQQRLTNERRMRHIENHQAMKQIPIQGKNITTTDIQPLQKSEEHAFTKKQGKQK